MQDKLLEISNTMSTLIVKKKLSLEMRVQTPKRLALNLQQDSRREGDGEKYQIGLGVKAQKTANTDTAFY